MSAVNKALVCDFYIWQGAPLPIVFDEVLANGSYFQYPATMQMVVSPPGVAPFTLTVGNGITLSTFNSTSNALFTALLTPAQSLTIPKGKFTPYKIIINDAVAPSIYMTGMLVGEGA